MHMFIKRGRKSRAQISVEYAMIIGLILFALAIAVGVAFFYSSSARSQIGMNQVDKVGKKIADTADSIYFLGAPSKATIDLTIPAGVQEIVIVNSTSPNYIKFVFKGASGLSYSSYYTKARLYNKTQDGGVDQPLNQTRFLSAGAKNLVVNLTNPSQGNFITFYPQFSN